MNELQALLQMEQERQQMEFQLHQLVHLLGMVLSVTGPMSIDKRQAELFKESKLEPLFDFSEDGETIRFFLTHPDGK